MGIICHLHEIRHIFSIWKLFIKRILTDARKNNLFKAKEKICEWHTINRIQINVKRSELHLNMSLTFSCKRSFNGTWAIQNSPKKNPTFCLIAFETLATPRGIASYIYKSITQSIRLDYSPKKASWGLWSISKKMKYHTFIDDFKWN